MKGLFARLLVALLAATVVGLSAFEIALLVGTSGKLGLQRSLLLTLAGAGVLIVALGLFFLRRAVLRPLSHLTELVRAADPQALSRFGAAPDDLVELSRAIVAQNQRAAEDKEQIARQLEELKAAHQELEGAQQRLVRAERLAVVGQLAAGLAHEIGNPLAILSGFVEVLRGGDMSPAEAQDTLARMARELDRIHATVRGLLDFSRTPRSATKEGELSEALSHVRELLGPQDRFRQIAVLWPDSRQSVWVPVDVDALTQLFLNLMLNAADAIAGKGQITVSLEAADGRVRLLIDDSGPGIPPEVLPHIFEPFFSTKPPGSGTGLGLSVCERIVAQAGGDLRADKSPLGGARFVITLPSAKGPGAPGR